MWDSCSDALITFNHDDFIGDVAYIIENDVLVHSILKELIPFNNITIRNDARIEKVSLERDGLTYGKVQLSTGEDFSTELLVNIDFITEHFILHANNIFYKFIRSVFVT